MSDEREILTDGINDYENGFFKELRLILKREFLLPFYERFIKECANIAEVVERANDEQVKRLEETIEQLIANDELQKLSPEQLAVKDSLFHRELFQITGDKLMVEKLEKDMLNPKASHFKIWRSICRSQTHKVDLFKCHSEIVNCIKDKDKAKAKGAAVKAMEKHFAIILPHFASILAK
jgi:DNA-binding GntR family transcriptional regulator